LSAIRVNSVPPRPPEDWDGGARSGIHEILEAAASGERYD
jgi:hypothetical protein